MEEKDKQQQISVDVVPTSSTAVTHTVMTPSINKIKAFGLGWSNTLALPDNPTDLLFDVTASISIPALVSNCWISLPLPDFIRIGGVVAVIVAVLVLWQLLAIKALRAVITFRLVLAILGVILGL